MPLYCGLDFGTSNTAISLLRTDESGRTVEHKIIAAEPTVIYFPGTDVFDESFYVGNAALEQYIGHNMRGRLIKSIKSLLPYGSYKYTLINKKPYQPDDILMWIFTYFKEQVEHYLQAQDCKEEITRICIGRPVVFSTDEAGDRLAEKRIMNAAGMAGFRERKLAFEPVGALYGFDLAVTGQDLILLADLGAGTSDFTLIENFDKTRLTMTDKSSVCSNSGVHIGGDDFDAGIFRHKHSPHFGYGSKYESFGKWLEVPGYIYYWMSNWVQLGQLKTVAFMEQLKEIRRSARQKEKIGNLIKLLENNLVYPLLKGVESAKIALSGQELVKLYFNQNGIEIDDTLSQTELEAIIAPDIEKITAAVLDLIAKNGKTPDDITRVVLTGGSSRLGAIRAFFRATFTRAAVYFDEDVFSTVAMGLALLARQA